VYNKIDRIGVDAQLERDAAGRAAAVWIGAAAGTGLDLLRDAISERLELQVRRLWLHLPPEAGALRARLYASGVVRDERSLEDGASELLVDLPAAELITWAALPGVRLLEAQPLPGLAACAALEPYLESGPEPQAVTVRC
jgi:GTP-binding protein HflX